MTERDFAIDVVRTLQAAGFQAVWAGGCVRDQLLGIEPVDYDIATSAAPTQVQGLFRRTIAMGASFGVIEVLGPRIDGRWLKVQVATFRRDGPYSDGRRPETVAFSSAEEDAQRRDFTINGLFYDPITDSLIDYVGGKADLQGKLLRAIGNPAARFAEDRLRVLRAVRIAARFDLRIDSATLQAGRAIATRLDAVSPERIADELRKLLAHPRRAAGLVLLKEFNLVASVLPEIETDYDVVVSTVGHLPRHASFPLTIATLLRTHSVRTANTLCSRLRLSNDERQRIVWLVSMQSSLSTALPRSRLYPILTHDGIGELIALHRAIAVSQGRPIEDIECLESVLQSTPHAVLNPPPLLSGNDLIALGWQPGAHFKSILDAVRAEQLDGVLHSSSDALQRAEQLRKSLC